MEKQTDKKIEEVKEVVGELARTTQEQFLQTHKIIRETNEAMVEMMSGLRDEVRQYRTGAMLEMGEIGDVRERLEKVEKWIKAHS